VGRQRADAARRARHQVPKLDHVVGLAHDLIVWHGLRVTTVDASGVVRAVNGTPTKIAVPAASATASRCALARTGHVWCWPAETTGPAREVPKIADASAIGDSGTHACMLRPGGSVTCLFGQPSLHVDQPRTLDVGGGAELRALAVGEYGDCAIRKDGTVWCWAWDVEKILHNRDSPDVPDAPSIAPHAIGVSDAVSLAVGFDHACAARSDGSVACWGQNSHGQLGRDVAHSYVDGGHPPGAVPGISDAIAVATGVEVSCALRKTGAVACWGNARNGSAGTYRTEYIATPVAVVWP
jgi:hypothetical protein